MNSWDFESFDVLFVVLWLNLIILFLIAYLGSSLKLYLALLVDTKCFFGNITDKYPIFIIPFWYDFGTLVKFFYSSNIWYIFCFNGQAAKSR